MRKEENKSIEILDEIIVGRVKPHIYAFTTNTIPNYLKIGDTYRSVSKRLSEWKIHYPKLEKKYERKAVIDDNLYFRDYSVHQYLEYDLNKQRLQSIDLKNDIYFSKEFFKNTEPIDIDNAIEDIKINYRNNTNKYDYYSSLNRLPETFHYKRGKKWTLRPNQQQVVDNFLNAIKNGRNNLLMYAVMRFGKSFTSLCCALEMDAKIVLVVSAKADVKDEWKKTVESAGNFYQYVFFDADDLLNNENIIKETLTKGIKVVLFITLQDIQGETIKEKHKQLFKEKIDLLVVDETHFGARGESYGKVLKDVKSENDNLKKLSDESINLNKANEELKKINARIKLHLSGTPYRILMGDEFEKEDIISFVQFSDIVREQEEWDIKNLKNDDINEWDNPYYGFPQMIRFAFNPNKSSREKMEKLRARGSNYTLSKLFEPCSITKDKKREYKKFKNENEILDLLRVIDGSKNDEELLGFLDYEKIKAGDMCRHIVMVLPYCASCDAMENLIIQYKDTFKNLNKYEVINISGLDSSKKYKSTKDIKKKIKECEINDTKTVTLTVNRMLTGSTVEQWDTMLYLKDTASPQEYDQSIFRLQNQYIRILDSGKGIIKENLKPQTLLVDFDPNRLFRMQEQKSLIYNVNYYENGNSNLRKRISEELRISPVITMNNNKIKQVNATNILEIVSQYNNQRSVSDEVTDIPIDLNLLKDKEIKKIIESQAEFDSKKGLTIQPYQGEEINIDIDDYSEESKESSRTKVVIDNISHDKKKDKELRRLESKIKTYYQRLLFFSFLTKDNVSSLDDILSIISKKENIRLSKNLSLDKEIIGKVSKLMDPFKRSKLDYKIQNISKLASDESLNPLDRALISLRKFNRMSESEIITSTKICEQMINLIPEDGLRKIVNKKENLLDIASKSGEYAVAIYKRLVDELGYSHKEVSNIIYSIPTSSIAYEFTRRFYEILDLNLDNIAVNFNTYELLSVKNDTVVDYEKIRNLLNQNKTFSKIEVTDMVKEEEYKMKFGAVVGNPPYQISDGGAQASSKPIYQEYINMGKNISNSYVSMISPSRWFTGGKGLDKFRVDMIEDKGFRTIVDYSDSKECFSDVEIKGGVNYFLWDKNFKGECLITNMLRENSSTINRYLKDNDLDIFIRYNVLYSIFKKVYSKNIQSFSSLVSSRKPFGLSTNAKIDDYKCEESVLIYGNSKIGYINKNKIEKGTELISQFKIFITYAYGAGEGFPHQIINKPFIPESNSVCTETYLVISPFETKDEACNALKYMKTKFFRSLVLIAKNSQHATSKTYRFVPIQNFKIESDINWNADIKEIDLQLYKKYKLNDDEINFINENIKDI